MLKNNENEQMNEWTSGQEGHEERIEEHLTIRVLIWQIHRSYSP